MIYLASSFSNGDQDVEYERYIAACRAAASLMRKGYVVLSPIAHSYGVALHGNFSGTWDFWQKQDTELLRFCDEVVVLMLPGWEESKGIKAEVALAEQMGKLVRYVKPEDL